MSHFTVKQVLTILRGDKNLSRCDLTGLYLEEVDFSGANLSYARLGGVNVSRANLSGANLAEADLTGIDLSTSNLTDANLSNANLAAARFGTSPKLSGATLPDGQTYTPDTDLSQFTGPDDALHTTLYHDAEADAIRVSEGTPDQYGRYATAVHWLTRGQIHVMLHLCDDISLEEEELTRIAGQVVARSAMD